MTSSNGMPIELVDISSRDPRLEAVVRLMHAALGDSRHSIHVTWLALRLFDELRPLHELGAEERFYLEAAGLLHDVGMMEKSGSHHKQSLHVIQNAALLPLDSRERMVIGSIARYHRKAMPSLRHDHFAALELDDQSWSPSWQRCCASPTAWIPPTMAPSKICPAPGRRRKSPSPFTIPPSRLS